MSQKQIPAVVDAQEVPTVVLVKIALDASTVTLEEAAEYVLPQNQNLLENQKL